MKIYMAGTAINLRGHKEQSLQNSLQLRYDYWLGKDTVRVEVSKLDHKLIELKIYRTYGDWYENPQWNSNSKGSIFQLDEWIIMGEGYQTGTYADLTQLNGRYIIRDDIKSIFLYRWRQYIKENHCSRIKNVEFEDFLDHFDLKIELA